VTTPLPRDAFPRRIETARLRLRKPARREEALYAWLALESYATPSSAPTLLSPPRHRWIGRVASAVSSDARSVRIPGA
jgi:hypothetical protein